MTRSSEELLFGMKVYVSKAIPDGIVLAVSPPQGPTDRRSDAERTTMIALRSLATKDSADGQ